jgi:hypothetical protein
VDHKKKKENRMSETVYRVDKFVVPPGAREEFLEKARRTHALLKAQPGFLQDFVIVQPERTAFYGMREVGFQEPGGHYVTFAQPVAAAQH